MKNHLSKLFSAVMILALALAALPMQSAQADTPTELFFSEYIEGSSNNKALEIYNGTGSAVDLAADGYNIQMFFNGSASAGLTINLTGTVADGDVFVLAQSSANAAILAQADQVSSASWYNGDDAVVLRKSTTVIDVIGQIGLDPGTEWGSGLVSTADNTLRRKADICAGDPDGSNAFDPSLEWDGYANDTFDGLGTHTANCTVEPTAPVINEFSASTAGTDVEYVEIYGDPNTDYSAYTVLEIEGDAGASAGTVDEVIPLGTTDANGLHLVNLPANALENGTVTLLLVKNFTGALNVDLDTDNDGIFDATPWDAIVDAVAVNDGGAGDLTYGTPTLGVSYDGLPFAPGGASRIPDGFDTDSATDWMRNDFDLAGIPLFDGTPIVGEAYNTPGALNQVVLPSAPELVINEVDYDQPGTDTAEFIEIKNNGSSAVSLDGWTLELVNGNAGGAAIYRTINLPAVNLPAGGYFVVCANAATVVNCDLDATPDTDFIQNGAPDAIGLLYNGTLMDAVSYEGNTGAPYTEGSGVGLVDDGVNATQSISRCPDGSDTNQNNVDFVLTGITPGASNDCASADPQLSINDVSLAEGDSGTTTFTFTVSLSAPAGLSGVTFDIATADNTATSPSDYTAKSLTGQTIPAGNSSYTFDVLVNGDMTNEPDETFFVNVTNVTGAVVVDGQGQGTIANDDAAITFIHDIQGSGSAVTGAGPFTVEAIVVGDYQTQGSGQLRGFFLQEEDSDVDADPATSEGIFVFCSNCPVPVSVGDKVRVTGSASEFFDMSQLTASTAGSVVVLSSGNPLPTPASIQLPVPDVPVGNLAAATTAINAYYETFEGMLVTFPSTLSVSEYFELARYGQVILTEGGRPHTFTAVNTPTAAGYINHQIDLATRKVILDDTDNRQNRPVDTPNTAYYHPVPGLSTGNYFRGGDTITNLTGVLHWSFAGQTGTDAWRIRPVTEAYSYAFTPANPRPSVPDVGGSLRVASFNVLNYFLTIDTTASNDVGTCGPSGTQDCRGADSAQELARQRAKLLTALSAIDADIYGFMEMENTPGVEPLADIVAGLPGYAYVDTGAVGTDAIRVGIIYKTATVQPVGNFAVLDTQAFVNPRNADVDRNRPAIAQTFEEFATGGRVTVVVNHLKSKGSGCGVGDDDTTTGQGNCNLTRTLSAQELASWLATDPTGSGDPDVLIIGDLNSYAKEDPIVALENAGYTNLVSAFGGSAAYSYVFDGQLGYLDHALSNASLTSQVAGVAEWHINADEIPLFDYNDDVRDGGEAAFEEESDVFPLYEANQFRTSDHDPVIVGLNLVNYPPELGEITVTPSLAAVGETVNASVPFSDPDKLDTHTATWDWGDGSTSAGTVTESDGSGTITGDHAYLTPGIYTVTVTVDDGHGNTDSAVYEFVVVYDPNGGFVTGGGWINSPEGAYTADPSLTGKATFGFVARYKKGANVPDGNTQFQFKAGALNFQSVSYDWLVVAGSKAQFKGEGTINGEGSYKFMITADDGSPDKFRIKIWYEEAGVEYIVYDNGSQQPLGGGSIVIHK